MAGQGWEHEARQAMKRARTALREAGPHARRLSKYLEPYVANVAASSVAFNLGLFTSQVAGYALRISCSTPALGSALGFLSVGASAAAAGQAGLHAEHRLRENRVETKVRWEHFVIDAAIGVFFYKALGGRFRSVFPSHLAFPGAFSNQSILAPGAQYATTSQKQELRRLLYRDGCHTCGTRARHVRVIGDHQPPNKVVFGSSKAAQEAARRQSSSISSGAMIATAAKKAGRALAAGQGATKVIKPFADVAGWFFSKAKPKSVKDRAQRYFPQCLGCSKKQAAAVKAGDRASPRQFLVLHPPWRFRVWALSGIFPGLQHHTAGEIPLGGGGRRFRGGFSADASATTLLDDGEDDDSSDGPCRKT